MESSMSRVLVETVVRNTLNNIRTDSARAIRKVVDLALNFSAGGFREELFQTAQTMLQNENSAYYRMVPDIANHADQERLVTFGMNLGYNSCTMGAKQIRTKEKQENFNIPWCISLKFNDDLETYYDDLVCCGESLGIYSWFLFGKGGLARLLALPEKHPDSAFFLLCSPDDISEEWIEQAAKLKNLMFVVKFEGKAALTCSVLREMELLYSVYCPYHGEDVPSILNDDLLTEVQELHPIFTALKAEDDCSLSQKDQVYHYVLQTRNKQNFQTVLWDLEYDNRWIDSIISNESCVAVFDEQGRLEGFESVPNCNLTQYDLKEILRCAFPKGGSCE